MEFQRLSSIKDVPASVWDDLFNCENPFVKHAYLLALEQSGSAEAESGWQPQHLLMTKNGRVMAAMPLYAKAHSYGEFVFDWAWAEAYQRHGLDYYPKLVTAIPFTPVAGPRIGVAGDAEFKVVMAAFRDEIKRMILTTGASGWHLLFADRVLQQSLSRCNGLSLLRREAVQFHWFNRGYRTFDDFLAGLRSARRKNLKRERRKVAEQGITLHRRIGVDILDEEWQAFYQCYQDTYFKRSGHPGYLKQGFFTQLREHMADQLMLVVARDSEKVIAASLFLFDKDTLYGRYWGSLADVSCLHFEACFYQGIEFCIEMGLTKFDPGTQGEHKLIRGFEPIKSASYHWIADTRFRLAIEDFVEREKEGSDMYQKDAETLLPFKKT